MEGWIKLHRSLLDNCTFQNPDLLKVWIWCLLKATHADRTQMVGFQSVGLHEGEFIFGRKVASQELKMNESKVYRLINVLEKLEKVHIKSNSKFSVVTIDNWAMYQEPEQQCEQQIEQQVNNKRTASEQQVNTNKNVKNLKNEKNKDLKDSLSDADAPNPKIKKPNPDAEPLNPYHIAAKHFRDMVLKANPSCKVPADGSTQLTGWARDIRLMFETDKRDKDQVRETLDYCFTKDAFWMHTCQSPSNFRRNYDKIRGNLLKTKGVDKIEAFKQSAQNGAVSRFLAKG